MMAGGAHAPNDSVPPHEASNLLMVDVGAHTTLISNRQQFLISHFSFLILPHLFFKFTISTSPLISSVARMTSS